MNISRLFPSSLVCGRNSHRPGIEKSKLKCSPVSYTHLDVYKRQGFKDWTIEALGIPSFTFELGKGRNPLPLSDFESVYKSIEETLVLACIM